MYILKVVGELLSCLLFQKILTFYGKSYLVFAVVVFQKEFKSREIRVKGVFYLTISAIILHVLLKSYPDFSKRFRYNAMSSLS